MTDYNTIKFPGHTLYNKDTQAKDFTVSDIGKMHIAMNSGEDYDVNVTNILKKNLKGINLDELTQCDFKYYLAWQLHSSYPDASMTVRECPHCGSGGLPKIKMSDLKEIELKKEYIHEGTRLQLDNFPGDSVVKIRLSIIRDDLESKAFCKKYNLDDSEIESVITACMLEPNGGNLEERYKLVSTYMKPQDYNLIVNFEEYFKYGLNEFLTLKCADCEKESEVMVRLNLTEFFPNSNNSGDVRTRILPPETPKDTAIGDTSDVLCEGGVVKEPTPTGVTGVGEATGEALTVKEILNNKR